MWSRKEVCHQVDIEQWPDVNIAALSASDMVTFASRKRAIELYFQNEKVTLIEKITGIPRRHLAPMARRCLMLAPDRRVFGFRALIPHIRIKPYCRRATCSGDRQSEKGGLAGALGELLGRHPDIEDALTRAITQIQKNKKPSEYLLRPRDLHRIFLKCAKAKGITDTEWPFNTSYKGIRSIQKYMSMLVGEHFSQAVKLTKNSVAIAHLNVGTGHHQILRFNEPYDAVEIDSYRIDAHLTIQIETPEGTERDVLLNRLWLIAIVDRASTAILAYSLVYRAEVTSDDVLEVIRKAVLEKWRPMELTVPLTYPSNGGLPSGVIPDTAGAIWNVTFFDGALAHLSDAVHNRARKFLGGIMTWGAPGRFERRPNVERTFRHISDNIFKRLPSTTGANPFKGRAPDGESKALKYRIRARDLEQVLDVYIAQHNASPSEGISYLSPLQYIKHYLEDSKTGFLLRHLPDSEMQYFSMMASTKEVTVRGNVQDGRRPYVQIDRVHYSSPVLAELTNLIGKKLVVAIDESDMRQVKAYLPNGGELGFLTALGRWKDSKHSRRDRKAINSLASDRLLIVSKFDDPMHTYLEYLSTLGKSGATNASLKKQSTDAARVAKETNLPLKSKTESQSFQHKSVINAPLSLSSRKASLMSTTPPVLRLVKNRR